MRTLLISERRAAVNVNFAVTKLLALAPHGADKLRLEGDTDLFHKRNKLSCLNIFAPTWKTNISTFSFSDDLRLLSVETEGWLSIHRVAMEDLFKIAKPHKINKVVELLEYKLAKALK